MIDIQPEYQVNIGKTKSNKKEIIFFVVSLLFFVGILATYIFFFLKKDKYTLEYKDVPRPDTEFYSIDPTTKEITKIDQEPVDTVITDIKLDDNPQEFRPEGIILKGYFDRYNQNSGLLTFKNQFLKAQDLQLLELNASKINDFYCWPTTAPNSEIDIRSVELGLSSPNSIIYHPDETMKPLTAINSVSENAYLIVQLEDEYDIGKINFVRKLIVVDCQL